MFKFIFGRFRKNGAAPASRCAVTDLTDEPPVRVGDRLLAKDDVVFGHPKGSHFVAWHACAGSRRFTAGKAYQVVRFRTRTKVAFVVDDQGFRTAVDRSIMRHFRVAHEV